MANHPAVLESSGFLSEAQLAELGWDLKPEGLCQDDTCVLVPDRSALVHDEGVDVAVLADLLDRPVVIDSTAGLVALGSPAPLVGKRCENSPRQTSPCQILTAASPPSAITAARNGC